MERRGSAPASGPSHLTHNRSKSLGLASSLGGASIGADGVTGGVPMSPGTSLGLVSPVQGAEVEWAGVQARTFCKWLNTKLESQGLDPMTDLVKDFSNGVKLIQLLEIMSETSLGRYNKTPVMRVQKAENASKALIFIRERGVKLTNIGPEDIVDGNLKLILGMIWTLILRFTIANITEEGLSAKDGLLLWCQRKTQPYHEVNVKDFKRSFSDGLAFCALIHRHRPELLDWNNLDKTDRRGNTEKAFKVAEQYLGIPRLLEVKDLCDVDVPDERSVMTYVAEFFHKFSSEDKMETGSRRIEKFADLVQGIWTSKNDFERRISILIDWLHVTQDAWSSVPQASAYPDAMHHLGKFADYKRTSKRAWVRERQELAGLYSNIQTKLRTYALRAWEPEEGLRLEDLERFWAIFLLAEAARSRAINARMREIKESLRKAFAKAAEDFVARLQRVEQVIGAVQGSLPEQMQTMKRLAREMPACHQLLKGEILEAHYSCLEAKVEENDYTVLTYDDLEYELQLAEQGIRKKIGFVDKQMVSAEHTNITPARLEEFEATFKHFDTADTNTLTRWEMNSALASLGMVYTDDEVEKLFEELEGDYGAVTYEAWLALLMEIMTDDASSADQLREAFRGMAGDKVNYLDEDTANKQPYVTDIDFQHAQLPTQTIRFLAEVMPLSSPANGQAPQGQGKTYDYRAFLQTTFAQ